MLLQRMQSEVARLPRRTAMLAGTIFTLCLLLGVVVTTVGISAPWAMLGLAAQDEAADLAVSASGAPNPVTVGMTVTYAIKVTNNGPDTATRVALTDTLPADVTFVSLEPNLPTCTVVNNEINCGLSDLAKGESALLTVVAQAPTVGKWVSTLSARASQPDANEADNDLAMTTTVAPPNSAPVTADQTMTTDEDQPLAVTLMAKDDDGNALTYTIVTQPANGALSGTAPNLTYTPAANYSGADSFTYKVNDGQVDSNTATVAIAINAVNDAPVLEPIADQTLDEGAKADVAVAASDADSDQITLMAN